MSMVEPYIFRYTVFTPTYNRAHTLSRVYESLKNQTFQNFEWLIVDDGSTDRTDELVKGWIKSSPFLIRYVVLEHSGKPAAVMAGIAQARGEHFLILDSDDSCVPQALERFDFHWQEIDDSLRSEFIGVTALCRNQDGELVGERFPRDTLDSDAIEIKYRYRLQGEKWGFLRTKVLRDQPWPLAGANEFVPEGVWWTKLAKQYKTRYVNEVLRIYHMEYDDDRLMNQSDPRRYAAGHVLWHQTILNEEIGWFRYKPLAFIRSAVQYARFSWHANDGVGTQWAGLSNMFSRGLWFICLPVAMAVTARDHLRF